MTFVLNSACRDNVNFMFLITTEVDHWFMSLHSLFVLSGKQHRSFVFTADKSEKNIHIDLRRVESKNLVQSSGGFVQVA
jgi:hypothetical protein